MTDVDDYLDALDEPRRAALEHVRRLVHQTVPEADESIRYGMPSFTYGGRSLLEMAAFRSHLSLFGNVDAFADQLADWDTSGRGTIRFTPDHPLPDELIVEIVTARRQQADGG